MKRVFARGSLSVILLLVFCAALLLGGCTTGPNPPVENPCDKCGKNPCECPCDNCDYYPCRCCDVCGEYPCACSESTIKAGTYTVYDTGRNGGMLSATVTVDATGKIVGLELTLPNESPSIGQPKGEELKANILAAGHTNVDVISTATLTSLGILRAVNKALVQAGVIQEPD